jgi:hypothetical protein
MAWNLEEDFLRQVSDAVYATAQSVALVGASRSLSQGNGISSCPQPLLWQTKAQ